MNKSSTDRCKSHEMWLSLQRGKKLTHISAYGGKRESDREREKKLTTRKNGIKKPKITRNLIWDYYIK